MRDFAQVRGAGAVTAAIADEALTRLEIDSLGLDAMDRRYLTMIATTYKGGPVGVETLAAGLAEPRDTVEEVIEPYLIQLGLLARTARGRCLNDGGWNHLGMAAPQAPQGGLFEEREIEFRVYKCFMPPRVSVPLWDRPAAAARKTAIFLSLDLPKSWLMPLPGKVLRVSLAGTGKSRRHH